MNVGRSQSQIYRHKDPKPKLAYTKSLPTGQINGSSRSHRSESSNRSSGSAAPKLPPNFRHGSVGGTNSVSSNGFPNDIELNSDESTTSSSLFHGIILVSIMLSSLISFVCSKIRRSCDSQNNDIAIENSDCPMAVVLFFSVITIISCLISFIIYFLHLIGQCDVSWLAKRKFAIEVTIISIVALLLIIGNSLMVSQTEVLDNYVGILSIVCSSLSIIGYGIRMTKLCSECKYFSKRKPQTSSNENQIDETALSIMKETLKSKLSADSTKNWRVSDHLSSNNPHNSVSTMRVISYVKRKRSVESTAKSVSQQPNGTNDQLNGYDVDIDDDVFIQ